MHEIDFLTLMALVAKEPGRAVFFVNYNDTAEFLTHASCALDYELLLRRERMPWRVRVPVGAQAQLHSTSCSKCGLSVETTDLKPI